MITVTKNFKYPNHLHAEAYRIGKFRQENNKELNKKKPEQVRPVSYNVNGALGELIFNEYLKEKKINYIPNAFYGDKPVSEHDVLVEYKFKIDVKAISIHTTKFTVNFEAHNKINKRVTHYVFVKLHANNECDIYACEKKYIDNWILESRILPNKATSTFYSKLI